jgi:thiol-disulfide isomerase/thioredoxin
MKKRSALASLAVLSLFAGAFLAPAAVSATKKSNVKQLTFSAKTVTGTAFNSKILRGTTPSVIWFWAPWCAICQNESANLVATAAKYKGRVNFVGVGALGNQPELLDFVEKTGTSAFPNIDDSSGAVWKRFGVVIQPTLIFIDRNGKISTKIGPSDAEFLESIVKALVAKK